MRVDVARRRGDQIAAGGQGLVDAAELRLEFRDVLQVLGAGAAVDRGQLAVLVGRLLQFTGRLCNARGRGEIGNLLVVQRLRFADSGGRFRKIAQLLLVPRQQVPLPCLGIRGGCCFLQRGDAFVETFVVDVDLDLLGQHRLVLFVVLRQLPGPIERGQRAFELFGPNLQLGRLQLQGKVLGIEAAGLGDLRQRLLEVAELRENFCQSRHVRRRVQGALGQRTPSGLGLLGSLENVIILSEVLAILRGSRR